MTSYGFSVYHPGSKKVQSLEEGLGTHRWLSKTGLGPVNTASRVHGGTFSDTFPLQDLEEQIKAALNWV